MGWWQAMQDKVRDRLRSFLDIQPPEVRTFTVPGELDWAGNCILNRLWYRGQAGELEQFWKQVPGASARRRFWAAVPTTGRDIEKIHVGIPATIVDTLANIVVSDLQQISVDDKHAEAAWDEMAEENGILDLVSEAVTETLVIGDGAFRISIVPEVSAFPVIEFIPGDRCEFEYERGRVKEVRFLTEVVDGTRRLALVERYGRGYIRTSLEERGREVPLDTVAEYADVPPEVTWDGGFMMAVPLRFFPSKLWPGRGGSVFDTRSGNFDALDECWSQWMDALRKARTKEYVPERLLPRDPRTGAPIMPNPFDNAYIRVDSTMAEGASDKVEVVQPEIAHESYIQTYTNALDQCLRGLISPATVGIDVKKLDNAEAQREKEKVTLYTRNQIVAKLQKALPLLVEAAVNAWQTQQGIALTECSVDVEFGEYANPSFESMVETVGKARVQGIMSVEAAVDELYGDSRDEEWKAAEVERLKAERGITEARPAGGMSWADILGAGSGE